MEHLVIGTAGHVDHGKTVLIKALTGVDTDRLQEEKERGISIDLGFAPFRLPSGRLAGVVDVPGHERFIHNMLAGAGGMDLVILVVDVTEGVMPQTREHLSILELLRVQKGIIAVTKIDLVDHDWLELVQEEVREELKGTFLESAPLQAVSALTGQGIPQLIKLIDTLTSEVALRDAGAPLRLPVDRSFSITGFGTVVTGTLLKGTVRVGDIVAVVPPALETRVRNIQVHDSDVREAQAGQRVALSLSGVEKEQAKRGSVVGAPGFYRTTALLDLSVSLLRSARRPLKNLDPVHFYLGTARVVGRVLLLDCEELKPGARAMAQIRLERPLVADRNDHFIIRSYSPMTTIGGGVVLNPFPARHRRFRDHILTQLKELEGEAVSGGDRVFLRQKLQELLIADRLTLEKATRMGLSKLEMLLGELERAGQVERLGEGYLLCSVLNAWEELIFRKIESYHRLHPLRAGFSRAGLRAVLPHPLTIRQYDALLERLEQRRRLSTNGELVSLYGYVPEPSLEDQKMLEQAARILEEGGLQPPSRREVASRLRLEGVRQEEIFDYLLESGELVKISEELYLHRRAYREALKILRQHFAGEKTLTLAQFRDLTGSSRKFIQPLLEHFDQQKLTRRIEGYRIPWKLDDDQKEVKRDG